MFSSLRHTTSTILTYLTKSPTPNLLHLHLASKMSTFNLPHPYPPIPTTLPPDLTRDQLLAFPAFQTWLTSLTHSLSLQSAPTHVFHPSPYSIRSVTVQSADFFGPSRDKLGFLKLRAEITNSANEHLPGSVFLRGGSVAMLLVLQPDDVPEGSEEDKWALMTVQPRVPAGSLSFAEIPAGMLEGGELRGAAAREIEEETGLRVAEAELVNLSEMVEEGATREFDEGEGLQKAMYPSPGGSDEYIPVFYAMKRIKRGELEGWRGKLTGLRGEGEKITLTICRLGELWKVGARDGKTLAAWALYSGLKAEGKI